MMFNVNNIYQWEQHTVPLLNKLAKRINIKNEYWCINRNRNIYSGGASCLICNTDIDYDDSPYMQTLRKHGLQHLIDKGLLLFI